MAVDDHRRPDLGLSQLGLEAADLDAICRALRQPQGLLIVAGPDNGGTTNSLYAMLDSIDARARAVATIECPVARPRISWRQYEVVAGEIDAVAGAGAADPWLDRLAQLRSQGPGVLLLDAIRTPRRARMAMETIASGSLVLAHVPAERAHHAIGYFQSLAIEPAELSRHLCVALAQRLVQKLCGYCSVPDQTADLRAVMAQAANTWLESGYARAACARPAGCAWCEGTGYRGRTLVYELLVADAAVCAMLEDGVIGRELEQSVLCAGRSIWDQGLRLVSRGVTSLSALRAAVREPV